MKKLKMVFEKQKEGGYTVYVLTLPGCISQGETKKEALANIKEAIDLYLETNKLNKTSHALLKKKVSNDIIKITIPLHPILKKGTLLRIIKTAGLTREEFMKLL